jgi:hypothetical protein
MSNRTWVCIKCGKTYRRDQKFNQIVKCALCKKECEYVHWKIHIPSPKNRKIWNQFWKDYTLEKQILNDFSNGKHIENTTLKILNMNLIDINH